MKEYICIYNICNYNELAIQFYSAKIISDNIENARQRFYLYLSDKLYKNYINEDYVHIEDLGEIESV